MNAVVPVAARLRRRSRSCQTFAPETRTTSRRSAGTERPAAAAARSEAVSSASAASRSLCVALLNRYICINTNSSLQSAVRTSAILD